MITTTKKIKLFLIDDHAIFLEGILFLLQKKKNLEIVGYSLKGSEAIDQIDRLKPDIVILDINIPDMNGFEITSVLKSKYPAIKILVISMSEDVFSINKILELGADGYMFKNIKKDELFYAINYVFEKGIYLNTDLLQLLMKQNQNSICEDNYITKREKDILKLITAGLHNKEIADQLSISIFTVKSHRKNILSKLNLRNTADLVRYAIENNLN